MQMTGCLRTFALAIVTGAVALAELPSATTAPGAAFAEIPASALAGVGPFRVRGYHQHLFPDRQPMEVFHDRLERLADLGYNVVIFGMGHPSHSTITIREDGTIGPRGCDTAAMRALVAHAAQLGLEPVFEMKYIGKQLPLIAGWLDEHPGLVIDPENRATVLDATYRMPDGRSAYEATALRLIGYLLDLYPEEHPPRYFHLGIDEFDADDMALLAGKMNVTPPAAFAHCINLGTDYLLERGVTPLIWGDTLLSPQLGTADHGITIEGYVPDPRLQDAPGGAYHADYKSGKVFLHTAVNHLRDRDRIIVADWHYSPSGTGEFPSMDYFQGVGFKDVWGCPWYSPINVRQFSRYAASRECGGMVATAWHMAYLPQHSLRLEFILRSSLAHFQDPALTPVAEVPDQFRLTGEKPGTAVNERRTGIVVVGDRQLHVAMTVAPGVTPENALLFVFPVERGPSPMRIPLTYQPEAAELTADFVFDSVEHAGRSFEMSFGYEDRENGYFYTVRAQQGFLVAQAGHAPPAAAPGILLEGDFSALESASLQHPVWLGGECATTLGTRRRQSARSPRPGGLDTGWFDRVWIRPSSYLTDAFSESLRIEMDVKLTGDFEGNDFCALLTKGTYNRGVRILMHRDRRVLFQIAQSRAEGPVWLYSKGPIPRDRWVHVTLEHRPARGGEPGVARILFDGNEQANDTVPQPLAPYSATIGVGCEFARPVDGPHGKRRPNFPGLVRSLRVSTLD